MKRFSTRYGQTVEIPKCNNWKDGACYDSNKYVEWFTTTKMFMCKNCGYNVTNTKKGDE